MNVNEMYEHAEAYGLTAALEPFGKNIQVSIPMSKSFYELPMDELNLSVRSSNGLRRAG